ncbi:hypothetical protein M2367_002051 [Aeromonas sp. BIGb0445]|nr:hypothetical protein [Aeromonas sp. BIGb0445]
MNAMMKECLAMYAVHAQDCHLNRGRYQPLGQDVEESL